MTQIWSHTCGGDFLSEEKGSFNVFSANADNSTARTPITTFERHPVRDLTIAKEREVQLEQRIAETEANLEALGDRVELLLQSPYLVDEHYMATAARALQRGGAPAVAGADIMTQLRSFLS